MDDGRRPGPQGQLVGDHAYKGLGYGPFASPGIFSASDLVAMLMDGVVKHSAESS